MNSHWKWAALSMLALAPAAAETALDWRVMKSPAGFRYAVTGGVPAAPAATLILLGGSMDDIIIQDTFERIAQPWRKAGGVIVTLDSPSHGAEQPADEKNSLRDWRRRLVAGDNFVPTFTARLRSLLDQLIRDRYADPARVAAAGISRGGFLALHFAAVEPRVRVIGAFTFVSELTTLVEFNGAEQVPLVRSLAAAHLVDRLSDRKLFGIIGSTDYRAGTARAVEFFTRLAETTVAQGRPPNAELRIVPVAGHQLELRDFAAGGEWLAQMAVQRNWR